MKKFLEDILVDPLSLKELTKEGECLVEEVSNIRYPIVNDVANFLKNNHGKKNTTELHEQFESQFDYAGHYQTDSVFFDYLKEDDSVTTRNERKRSRQSIIHSVPENAEIILDVGCGGGWVAEHFLPLNKKIISLDISSLNPQKVLHKFPHVNHAAIVADVYQLPFKNDSFDCIIASEIIEHVIDPLLFIDILSKKIKTGGKIILITPYNEMIEYNICVHCNKPTPKNAHLHSFNEENIKHFSLKNKVQVNTKAFNNKYVNRLRLYNLISFLPYSIWKSIDKIINFFIKKPTIFLIELTKLRS